MAFDPGLAERVARLVGDLPGASEKRMFGGLAFMLDGHLCVGVMEEDLIVRLGRDAMDHALAEPGTRPFDFTGRAMRGWVLVSSDATAEDADLEAWVEKAVSFVRALPPK